MPRFASYWLRPWTEVESQVKSRRLDGLQGFRGAGACSPGQKLEIWSLQTARNALELSNPTTITLFWIILNFFTIPSGGPFWLLGGECAPRAPPPPPCLRACTKSHITDLSHNRLIYSIGLLFFIEFLTTIYEVQMELRCSSIMISHSVSCVPIVVPNSHVD